MVVGCFHHTHSRSGTYLQHISLWFELNAEVEIRRSRIHHHLSVRSGRGFETRQVFHRQFAYLGEMGLSIIRAHRLFVVYVCVIVTHIVIRAVRLRHTHQIRLVVLRVVYTAHTHHTVYRVDLLSRSTIGRFLRVVFIHAVSLDILLIGCKEITAATIHRVVQQIETEDRTRGLIVFRIRKSISRFTFSYITCT